MGFSRFWFKRKTRKKELPTAATSGRALTASVAAFADQRRSLFCSTRTPHEATRRCMDADASAQQIFALERPHPSLWTLYFTRAILTGPLVVVMLPLFFFRYRTLRYRFDEEGIHMRVGVLFRREVNLTYARIQDIHLQSGMIQRWLGLADIQIQTASGSANAELVIEGFKEFEAIRDFLYTRMRGAKSGGALERIPQPPRASAADANDETVTLLLSIRDELRRTRELLEQRNAGSSTSTTNPDV